MSTEQGPLSLAEIDEFLLQVRKRNCSWCDGTDWGVHIDADALEQNQPGLRSLARIRLEVSDSGMKGHIALGTEGALIVAIAECQHCGHIELFNYFAIMRKVRAQGA